MTTKYGLTLSSEEHAPARLVAMAVEAEAAGFDFVSISDHYHPWIGEQGHSPFVWSVLGAIAHATEDIGVGVGVSCPTFRFGPVVSAHAAATTACLLDGRFTWGLGSGESLNEHVTGMRWPPAEIRLEMLEEAVEVIRALWTGESVTHHGEHFTVEDARIYDLPQQAPPVLISAFGEESAKLAASHGDGLWTTGSNQPVIETYREHGGDGPIWAQLTICWDEERSTAIERAHRLWPNTALPGTLAQDLRTVLHFEEAVKLVSPEDVAEDVPCGAESGAVLERIAAMIGLGIDHVYIHQVGELSDGFLAFWAEDLRPALE
jgi:coenzyme F420-dependent glucose-6-phosphate dehydrogenase